LFQLDLALAYFILLWGQLVIASEDISIIISLMLFNSIFLSGIQQTPLIISELTEQLKQKRQPFRSNTTVLIVVSANAVVSGEINFCSCVRIVFGMGVSFCI
jgi:hypothetical protein